MQTINLRTGMAAAPGFGGAVRVALAKAWDGLRVWARILRTRGDLDGMDDRMLADLGISRAQADFQLSHAPWTLANRPPQR